MSARRDILPSIASSPVDGDDEDLFSSPNAATPPSKDELRDLVRSHGDRYQPILAVLRDQPWKELVTSRDLIDALGAQGIDWSERTLRLYLAEMSEVGLIERHGRRGYRLAAGGADVARELTISRRLGSILYRMEETMCQLSFDLAEGTGLVSINAYVIPREFLLPLCDGIETVFKAGLAVGSRVLLAGPGDDILGREVPAGCIGLGTMCSLTIASLFMRRGIPTHPIFGGLLQVEGGRPQHFLEMIRYDATTLSPNEVFIRANFTSVSDAARSGSGAITASFREAPMSALPALRALVKECDDAGFPGILVIGRPGQPLLNIPVHEGRVGLVLCTGLNPLASLWERDHRAFPSGHGAGLGTGGGPGDAAFRLEHSRPMVGPAPYERFIAYQDFRRHATALLAPDSSASAPAATSAAR